MGLAFGCHPGARVSARVILLGMDGANPDLLLRWSEEGLLPTLRSLRERGMTCRLDGPPGCGDDGAWATAYTGVWPSAHGRFYYRRLQAGSYDLPPFGDDDLRHEPVWNTLSRAGRRVAVVDVPKSPLPRSLNGVYLGDWLVHGRTHRTPVSYPVDFAGETIARFGAAPESLCHFTQPALDAAGYEAMLQRLEGATRMKRDMCLSTLESEPWDLFFTVFKESHCAGHHGWHLHDTDHPEHSPGIAAVTGDPLLRAYRAIDAALADLIAAAGADTTVLAFSVIGMGPNYGLSRLLPQILARLDPEPRLLLASVRRMAKPLGSWLYRATGKRTRKLVASTAGAIGSRYRTGQPAFSIEPSEHVAGIRLNLAGREPRGRIRPGADAEAYCRRLTADLMEIVDPESGERLVEDVVPIRELYSGPAIDCLPDLLVFWNLSRAFQAAASPRIGVITLSGDVRRTGAHMPGGVLFAAGPGIAGSGFLPPRPLVDLAPTVGALLGVRLDDSEGTALQGTLPGGTTGFSG